MEEITGLHTKKVLPPANVYTKFADILVARVFYGLHQNLVHALGGGSTCMSVRPFGL